MNDEKEIVWIDHKPDWDDDLFDGWGGFVGETEDTRILCDHEFAQILPWPDMDYIVFPHELCVTDKREEE